LHDYHTLENALGRHIHPQESFWQRVVPAGVRLWLYRFALERGYLDSWLNDWLARPFQRVFQACDGWERRWTDWLSATASRESDRPAASAGSLDDLA
jgi:NAD(P)H-quinone oxidoreductase subunit 5